MQGALDQFPSIGSNFLYTKVKEQYKIVSLMPYKRRWITKTKHLNNGNEKIPSPTNKNTTICDCHSNSFHRHQAEEVASNSTTHFKKQQI